MAPNFIGRFYGFRERPAVTSVRGFRPGTLELGELGIERSVFKSSAEKVTEFADLRPSYVNLAATLRVGKMEIIEPKLGLTSDPAKDFYVSKIWEANLKDQGIRSSLVVQNQQLIDALTALKDEPPNIPTLAETSLSKQEGGLYDLNRIFDDLFNMQFPFQRRKYLAETSDNVMVEVIYDEPNPNELIGYLNSSNIFERLAAIDNRSTPRDAIQRLVQDKNEHLGIRQFAYKILVEGFTESGAYKNRTYQNTGGQSNPSDIQGATTEDTITLSPSPDKPDSYELIPSTSKKNYTGRTDFGTFPITPSSPRGLYGPLDIRYDSGPSTITPSFPFPNTGGEIPSETNLARKSSTLADLDFDPRISEYTGCPEVYQLKTADQILADMDADRSRRKAAADKILSDLDADRSRRRSETDQWWRDNYIISRPSDGTDELYRNIINEIDLTKTGENPLKSNLEEVLGRFYKLLSNTNPNDPKEEDK